MKPFRPFPLAACLMAGFCCFLRPALHAQPGAEGTFFLKTDIDKGYAICPASDGNLYLAGQKNELLCLTKMTREGDFLSTYLIDLSLGPAAAVTEIIEDSDGNITGCGNYEQDKPGNGFIFRYDPQTATILWVRTLEGINTLVNGIVELTPGGNFLLYHNPRASGGDDAETFQVFRANGNVIPGSTRRYHLGASEDFHAMIVQAGHLYATGRVTDGASGGKMRQGLSKFDLSAGQLLWTKLGPVSPGQTARLQGRDLVLDQGAIVSTFSGNDNGDTPEPSFIFLQKTTPDGEVVWVKKYDLPGSNGEVAEEIVSVPDGYVLLGSAPAGNQSSLFILKTDKNGDLLWAYTFSDAANNELSTAAQGQLLALDDYLYFTGYAANRMVVVKTGPQGKISPDCTVLTETAVNVTAVPDPAAYPVTLSASNTPAQVFDIIKPVPAGEPLEKTVVCFGKGANTCQLLPNLTWETDGSVCTDGKLGIYYKICNAGNLPVAAAIPVTFYNNNPTSGAAEKLGTYTVDVTLAPGECLLDTVFDVAAGWFPDGIGPVQSVFSVLNDAGNLTTPFSLDSLPGAALPECDYTDNLDTYELLRDGPPLELGPDVIVCSDTVVTFSAGPDYYSYRWQDGSTAATFSATTPGIYAVEVADVCGFIQRDSVFFSFSLLPDTQFPDSAICPGVTLTYSVPGFDQYVWAPAAGLNCTNCASVNIQPSATTQYTLLATDSAGCVLTDTFVIEVLPHPTLNRVFEFCPGTSVTIDGITYTQPGIVVDTLPSATGGCDTLAVYTLQFVDLPQPSTVTIQCPDNLTVTVPKVGDSAAVFYDTPTAATDCPCGGVSLQLEQGLPSGAVFPPDATLVCYTARDECGTESSCCFTVTLEAEPVEETPCDVKATPCIRFEVLGISQNPARQKTYRMRVTNTCAGRLEYVAFELPDGLSAVAPAGNTTYTTPGGRPYAVRNPNYSPYRSIRFETAGSGIAGGQSDIFEYTLPPQAAPLFVRAVARLEPQLFYETHLNVFDCTVQQTPGRPGERNSGALPGETFSGGLRVYPNPATSELFVQLPKPESGQVRIRIFDALGRLLYFTEAVAPADGFRIGLPANWPAGVYGLESETAAGARATARFMKK